MTKRVADTKIMDGQTDKLRLEQMFSGHKMRWRKERERLV